MNSADRNPLKVILEFYILKSLIISKPKPRWSVIKIYMNGILSFVSHFRWCPIFVGVPFSLKKGHQRKMGHQRKTLIFLIVFLGHQRKKGYQRKMGHQWKWDTNENGTPTKIFYVVSVISWVVFIGKIDLV